MTITGVQKSHAGVLLYQAPFLKVSRIARECAPALKGLSGEMQGGSKMGSNDAY
jgi:hypothetical protein